MIVAFFHIKPDCLLLALSLSDSDSSVFSRERLYLDQCKHNISWTMKLHSRTQRIAFVGVLLASSALAFQEPVHFSQAREIQGASPILKASSSGSNDDVSGFLSQLADGLEFGKSPAVVGMKALIQQQAGNYDQDTVRAQLDAFIDKNPVAMLSFTNCPYCKKAKEILNESGAVYETMELDKMPSGGLEFRSELAQITDRTSVPAIWIGGTFVGGCNDGGESGTGLSGLEKEGTLQSMLQEAGALQEEKSSP